MSAELISLTKELIEFRGRKSDFPEKYDDEMISNNYNVIRIEERLRHREQYKKRIEAIVRGIGIHEDDIDSCIEQLTSVIESYANRVPDKPIREYRRGEDIIAYIRAEDGLGPWVAAGKLNRPLMVDIAPGAHIALTNYLRRNSLPEDLHIPTKSELVASEQSEISAEEIRAAQKLLSRVHRERQRRKEQSCR